MVEDYSLALMLIGVCNIILNEDLYILECWCSVVIIIAGWIKRIALVVKYVFTYKRNYIFEIDSEISS